MARKDNSRNKLELALRARSLPRGVTPRKYYARLLEHIRFGTPLPSSWEVDLGWRNPNTRAGRTKHWQFDDFENAISDSREGFVSLVADILKRKLRKV